MDRRLDAAGLLVAASALLLAVSLFLGWFGGEVGDGLTAWEAFEVLDLALIAAAVAAVAAAFGRLPTRVLPGAAALVGVVVVSQLLNPPPAGQDADLGIGAWLALAAAVGMAVGAALTAAQIAVTVDVRGRERRPRVAAVDKRAPGVGGDGTRDDAAGDPGSHAAAPHDAGPHDAEPGSVPVAGDADAPARPPGSPVVGGSVADDLAPTQSFPAPTEPLESR